MFGKHGIFIHCSWKHKKAIFGVSRYHSHGNHGLEPTALLSETSNELFFDSAIQYQVSTDDSYHSLFNPSFECSTKDKKQQKKGTVHVNAIRENVLVKINIRILGPDPSQKNDFYESKEIVAGKKNRWTHARKSEPSRSLWALYLDTPGNPTPRKFTLESNLISKSPTFFKTKNKSFSKWLVINNTYSWPVSNKKKVNFCI